MSNVYDILKERGFIEQATHEEEIRKLFENESVAFYIGFDPTADSLHVGHFIQVMVMMHMQRAGHIPIALVGGGNSGVNFWTYYRQQTLQMGLPRSIWRKIEKY